MLRSTTLLAMSLTIACATGDAAAIPDGWFAWPATEPVDGSALDLRALNQPITGHIVVKDGHFITPDGKRVRFLATNMGGNEAFPPTQEEADEIARRLAKAGINLVRLHHLDNVFTGNGGSLWDLNTRDRHTMVPQQLDRLHRLIAALKAQGIYVNLNLKVSRELTEADGMPESINQVDKQKFVHQKRLDIFNRRWIDLQKQYARELLTTVNPYTKLSPIDDPALAKIEINNENSLAGYWTRDLGRDLHLLPEPFKGELTGLWNRWLAKRYADDKALAAAWMAGVTPPGPSIITAANTWTAENQGGSKLTITAPLATGSEAQPVEFAIGAISGTDWHVQAHVNGLTLQEGATYTVEFSVKASSGRGMSVAVNKDKADWHNMGLQQWLSIGTGWQKHSLTFTARATEPASCRFSFLIGQAVGSVWIKDLSLAPGVAGGGLLAGQSMTAGSVPIPQTSTQIQWRDWISFLADTERAYSDEMRDFLKNDLKARQPMALSQVDYGGLTGLHREQRMDFADTHAYWEHPSFAAGKAWSATEWTIGNTPQVNQFGDRAFGELGKLAMTRVANKPFSVSEYDHPAPSDYVCEMMPSVSAFGALQDWDAIYAFALAGYGSRGQDGRIQSFFDHQHHPAKWSFFPASALMFRQQQVPALTSSTTVRMPAPFWYQGHFADELWNKLIPTGSHGYLTTRMALSDTPLPANEPVRLESQGTSATGVARLATTAQGKAFIVDAPTAVAIVGHLGGDTVKARGLQITTPRFGRDFAAITAVPLDGKPMPMSKRVLVTLVGRAENQGMGWNAERTTNHGNWGHGPTIVERIPATISLPADGPRTIHVLAPDGSRKAVKAGTIADGRLSFTVAAEDQTVHYEITAP